MTKMTGKISWIGTDLRKNSVWIPKSKSDGMAVTALIENAIIDDHMIKFVVIPYEYDGIIYSYNVNLIAGDIGPEFVGEFSDAKEIEYTGQVDCVVYQNKEQYFLYGKWTEDKDYTWLAIIDKAK